MITVNGEKLDFSGTVTELNENIVPKAEYENTSVSDGDKLEIVRFVGGG